MKRDLGIDKNIAHGGGRGLREGGVSGDSRRIVKYLNSNM